VTEERNITKEKTMPAPRRPMPMPDRVPEPGFYYHYKHDPSGAVNNYAYEVVGIGFHTEDSALPGDEHFLIYRPLYEDAKVYVAAKVLGMPCYDNRPLRMWMGSVEKDGKTVPRFKKITDPKVFTELAAIRSKMYP
jgi:hypothetical protein